MYNYNYGNGLDTLEKVSNTAQGMTIWTAVSFILAIIGGILVYFLFIKGKNELNANLTKLRDLLDFKKMLIEPILKILYLVLTIFVILFSFNLIAVNFIAFLCCLIIGPIIIRVIYESAMILIMIWKNTQEINNHLAPKSGKKEAKEKE